MARSPLVGPGSKVTADARASAPSADAWYIVAADRTAAVSRSPDATRDRLVDAAERLFAGRGGRRGRPRAGPPGGAGPPHPSARAIPSGAPPGGGGARPPPPPPRHGAPPPRHARPDRRRRRRRPPDLRRRAGAPAGVEAG